MKKRLLSLVLVFAMIFALSTSVFAVDGGDITDVEHITGSCVITPGTGVEYTFYLSQNSYYAATVYIPEGYAMELRKDYMTIGFSQSNGTSAQINKNSLSQGAYKLIIYNVNGDSTGIYNIYQYANW